MFEWPPLIESHSFLASLLKPGAVVLDLGLNRGLFALALIERYGARVYGAEPVNALYEALPRHPDLTPFRVALTGKDAPIRINVFADRCASAASDSIDRVESVEQVEGCTLGTFLGRAGITHVDLAKIDIEGAEIGLFQAASDAELRSIDQYTIEFHDFLLPEIHREVEAIKKRLVGLGFLCFPFSLDNTNVLFVKRECLSAPLLQSLWLRLPVRFLQGICRRIGRWLGG